MWNYRDGDWQQARAEVDPIAQQQFSEKLERIKLECESARLGLLKTLNVHQLLDANYCEGLMNISHILELLLRSTLKDIPKNIFDSFKIALLNQISDAAEDAKSSHASLLSLIESLPDEIDETIIADEDIEMYTDTDLEEYREPTPSRVNINAAKQALIERLNAIPDCDLATLAELTTEQKKLREILADLKLLDIVDHLAHLPPESELMMILAIHIDDDLKQVMTYRQFKTGGKLIIVNAIELQAAIKCAQSLGYHLDFPHISKLSILHHSGRGLSLETSTAPLLTIAHTLSHCAIVVERGCGMDEAAETSKEVSAKIKREHAPSLSHESIKQKLKTGEIQFFKGKKAQQIREHTLELSAEEAEPTKSGLLKNIEKKLIEAGLGRNHADFTLKFYVRGYRGSLEGAIPDTGLGADGRFLSLPKAIKTTVSRHGGGTSSDAAAKDDTDPPKALKKPKV